MNEERNMTDRSGNGAKTECLTPEQEQFVQGMEYAMDMVRNAATVYCDAMREDGLPRHNALLDERVNDVADFIIRYLSHGLDGVVTDMRDSNAMEAENMALAGEGSDGEACAAPAAEGSPHDAPDGQEPDGDELEAQIESLLKEEAELEARLMEIEKLPGFTAREPGEPEPDADEEEPGREGAETPCADGSDAEDGGSVTYAAVTEHAEYE